MTSSLFQEMDSYISYHQFYLQKAISTCYGLRNPSQFIVV